MDSFDELTKIEPDHHASNTFAVRSHVKPAVTIVIPNYNREALIGRTIHSCLRQTYKNFEVIVVDDGSSDASLEVIKSFADPRIVILTHSRNRGVCPARNTGADAAKADWIIMLDSDDELLDIAVETVARTISTIDEDIGCIYYRCVTDDGSISPAVGPVAGRLGYEAYLQYIQSCSGGSRDLLYCVRQSTFSKVRFPDNYGLEDQYHLDFSRMFVSLMCPDIIRLYHQDAPNSLVKRTSRFDAKRDRQFVYDRAENIAGALKNHREALRLHAPSLLEEYDSRLLTLWLLCGRRSKAASSLLLAAKQRSRLTKSIIIFSLGMMHPALLAVFRSYTRKIRTKA